MEKQTCPNTQELASGYKQNIQKIFHHSCLLVCCGGAPFDCWFYLWLFTTVCTCTEFRCRVSYSFKFYSRLPHRVCLITVVYGFHLVGACFSRCICYGACSSWPLSASRLLCYLGMIKRSFNTSSTPGDAVLLIHLLGLWWVFCFSLRLGSAAR